MAIPGDILTIRVTAMADYSWECAVWREDTKIAEVTNIRAAVQSIGNIEIIWKRYEELQRRRG